MLRTYEKEFDRSLAPFPPDALCGRGVDTRPAPCFLARLAPVRWLPWRTVLLPVLSDAERRARVRGPRPPLARAVHLSLDTDDGRARLDPGALGPRGAHAGVDVAEGMLPG